jgi:hypothetical protein
MPAASCASGRATSTAPSAPEPPTDARGPVPVPRHGRPRWAATKRIRRGKLGVPGRYRCHPFTGELAGFALREGAHEPIPLDAQGRIMGAEATRLRRAMPDGTVLPVGGEVAGQAQRRIAERAARSARPNTGGARRAAR